MQTGAKWRRLMLAVVLVSVILVATFAVVVHGGRVEARKAVLKQRLHGLSHAIRLYRSEHGAYPPDLRTLEDWQGGAALGKGGLESYNADEQMVQYVIPQSDDPYEALLYHWPPFHGEASFLYQNLHVDSVPVTEKGVLTNPLTGRVIRGAEDPGEDSLRRRVTVIRAIADFMQDHGDDVPEQLVDLAPYVPNADVLERLTGGQTRLRQWAQARREANKHARSQRLSQLWSALRAYRREHGGTPPDQLDQDFVDGYLDDPLALTWPGFQLVYCGPDSDVVAYWWPSLDGGTPLLFADGGTHWVELDEDGSLTNPRTGAVIRPARIITPPVNAAGGEGSTTSSPKTIKVAAVQFISDFGRPQANRRRLEPFIRKAAAAGAKIVVLPEAAITGYTSTDLKTTWQVGGRVMSEGLIGTSPKRLAETVPGESTTIFCKIAKELNIYLTIPLVEVDAKTGRFFNTVVLAGPTGELVLHYRKLNPWPWAERGWATKGDRGLQYVDTPYGRLGLLICYDINLEPPRLKKAGIDILLYSIAWVDDAKSTWFSERLPDIARQGNFHIVGANWSVPEAQIWSGYGHSLIIDRSGKVRAKAANDIGEEIVYSELPLASHSAESSRESHPRWRVRADLDDDGDENADVALD